VEYISLVQKPVCLTVKRRSQMLAAVANVAGMKWIVALANNISSF
jgi:hypothetical protein